MSADQLRERLREFAADMATDARNFQKAATDSFERRDRVTQRISAARAEMAETYARLLTDLLEET